MDLTGNEIVSPYFFVRYVGQHFSCYTESAVLPLISGYAFGLTFLFSQKGSCDSMMTILLDNNDRHYCDIIVGMLLDRFHNCDF